MVLSTRLAHVLNHLITSLTTYLSNSTEHVAKSGKTRQKTEKREQWTLSYFILFSKKIRMKNILSSQKSRKINPRLVKSGIRAAGSQKLTIRALGKDMNRETKNSCKPVSNDNISPKI